MSERPGVGRLNPRFRASDLGFPWSGRRESNPRSQLGKLLLSVLLAFGIALAGGGVGYLFDHNVPFGNSTAAGIGFLAGFVLGWVVVFVLLATGGYTGMWERLRHRPALCQEHSVLSADEPAESVARWLHLTGRSDKRFGIGAIAFGVAIAVACIVGGLHERSLTQAVPGWTTTTGRVLSEDELSCKGGCEWQVVVAFEVPGQGTVQFQPPNAQAAPYVGERVLVDYPRSDPSRAHDLSDTDNDSTGLFVLAPLALFVCGITGAMSLHSGRHSNRAALTLGHPA